MKEIKGKRFGEERALYAACGVQLTDCSFDGAEDGESALKEARDIVADGCFCNLRYPFWHNRNLTLRTCELTPLCRAALWYSEGIRIEDCKLMGIKALRECRGSYIKNCSIQSPEFGWFSRDCHMEDCTAESEYFFLKGENLTANNLRFHGKYSFQYVKNARITNSVLQTKDAFWHAENAVVENCEIGGEYLGWYSNHLTFIRCRISGTQPLCYCKNLTLIDCELNDADLCFEKSHVNATLTSPVISIKNPASGTIKLPALGCLIRDDAESLGEVITDD